MIFEEIEDAITAKLKTVQGIKTVETYAGQLEDEIERLPVRFPAVYIVYGGSAFEAIDGPNYRENVEFNILVCGKNLRGQADSRKSELGAYKILTNVLEALVNEDFDIEIEQLCPVSVKLVAVTKGIAIYGIDFKTGFDKTYN